MFKYLDKEFQHESAINESKYKGFGRSLQPCDQQALCSMPLLMPIIKGFNAQDMQSYFANGKFQWVV